MGIEEGMVKTDITRQSLRTRINSLLNEALLESSVLRKGVERLCEQLVGPRDYPKKELKNAETKGWLYDVLKALGTIVENIRVAERLQNVLLEETHDLETEKVRKTAEKSAQEQKDRTEDEVH